MATKKTQEYIDKTGVNNINGRKIDKVDGIKLMNGEYDTAYDSELGKRISVSTPRGRQLYDEQNPSKSNSSEGFKSTDYSKIKGKNNNKKLSDRVSNGLDDAVNQVGKASGKVKDFDDKIQNSNLPQFTKNRLHDRLKGVNGRLGGLKNNINKANKNFKTNLEKIQKTAKVVGSFIAKFWLPIAICIVLVFGIIPLIIAIAMQVGNSPHFYCNLDAPASIKSSTAYRQYCGGYSGGNEDIAQAAVSLAYDLSDINAQPNTYVASHCASGVTHAVGGHAGTYPDDIATQLYVDVHDAVDLDNYYASCDRGTCTAVRWAGADDDFPAGPCPTIVAYLEKHTEKWEKIGVMGDDITKSNYESELQPGDVMICDGHVGIYVGIDAVKERFPNSNCEAYAASYGQYCPKLQGIDYWFGAHSCGQHFTVYRNVQADDASKYKDLQF